MLSAILVEDEMLARERLKVLLADCAVSILAEFDHAQAALEWLAVHAVDIVFVDVGLPEMDGLEFVATLKRNAKNIPSIIFTTAHEEHAYKAFELAAVDYLLKPIRMVRLQEALNRTTLLLKSSEIQQEENGNEFTSFVINTRNKVLTIPWQQARYLKADHKYVILYTADAKEYVLDKTLLYWEEKLAEKVIRLHRGILVMKHALEGLIRLSDEEETDQSQWYAKVLDLPEHLLVSRRQLPIVRKYISQK
ncbi:LytR/AlgR family response regulator transcription factor [Neisseria sp. Ec49-e6-T10]|uniref:LytR/AlgR family response regulator transcription factor n=1 Tax=Neisseria sp. Ec49-e6-T10 TaxID=3140744 RepID=UPI003EBEDFE9